MICLPSVSRSPFYRYLIKAMGTLLIFMAFFGTCYAYYDTSGHRVDVSKLKGKWVILNYWADWCEGCMAEVPELNQFYLDNHDKNIVFYGINYDQLPLPDLKKAMRRAHVHFPNLIGNPGDEWRLGPIDIIPVTFIIDPRGVVVKTLIGPSDEHDLIQSLHELQQ